MAEWNVANSTLRILNRQQVKRGGGIDVDALLRLEDGAGANTLEIYVLSSDCTTKPDDEPGAMFMYRDRPDALQGLKRAHDSGRALKVEVNPLDETPIWVVWE